jgi:hypothetical protein
MIESLSESFKVTFSDCRSHVTNVSILENPPSLEATMFPMTSNLKWLICSMTQCSYFTQESLINVHVYLTVCLFSSYISLHEIWQVYSVAHLHMKRLFHVWSKRCRIPFKNHKYALIWCDANWCSEMEPNVNKFSCWAKAGPSSTLMRWVFTVLCWLWYRYSLPHCAVSEGHFRDSSRLRSPGMPHSVITA